MVTANASGKSCPWVISCSFSKLGEFLSWKDNLEQQCCFPFFKEISLSFTNKRITESGPKSMRHRKTCFLIKNISTSIESRGLACQMMIDRHCMNMQDPNNICEKLGWNLIYMLCYFQGYRKLLQYWWGHPQITTNFCHLSQVPKEKELIYDLWNISMKFELS